MKKLSVIILTYNEEKHLARCLESVKEIADEIIVVDSFSADKTEKIAEKYSAKFIQHEYINQAQQFNWALENVPIAGDWILRLDADEYLTPELGEEINKLISINPLDQHKSVSITGYYIKRRVIFMGRWIKYGGYYPTWILRLFEKGKAKQELREMDEHIVLEEGTAGYLKNDFVDENLNNLSWWTEKHNNFSTREMNSYPDVFLKSKSKGDNTPKLNWKKFRKDNFYMRLPLFLRAFLFFLYRFFFRLGFLDGKEGVIFHFLQCFWYRFLIDAKIYEERTKS